MMSSSSDYNYDGDGQFYPFFVLTITALITFPLTYNVLKTETDLEKTAPRIQSDFRPQDDEIIQSQKRKQKRRERKLKRMLAAAIGYLLMAGMVYLIIVTARTAPKIWDPYDILGVSRNADERALKKFYNRLSLKYHPDKAVPDSTLNQTMEMINDRWVEMTKAYKALTDEDVRNNYLQYGHPDGKQSFSMGIALPKFIFTQGNGKYVLLFYGLLLGVILPYTVGKWWYGTQALTKDKVLVASAGKIFKEYKEDISEGGVLAAVSTGDEFQEQLSRAKAEAGLAKVEKAVLASPSLKEADRKTLREIEDPVRRKALSLLWAYLDRAPLDDSSLQEQKYEIAPVAFRLNDCMTSISLAFNAVAALLSSYHTSQNLIQAIAPNASPMLQLPYFTPKTVESIQGSHSRERLTVQKFMSLPSQTRRSLASSLSDSEFATAMQVATQILHLHIAKSFFKVTGDRVITSSSIAHLVVKARFIPVGTPAVSIPPINELDLEDIDPDEDDVDAITGRKPALNKKRKTADGEVIADDSSTSIQPPLAHAPYYPRDHSPRWHIFLADPKAGRIIIPPFTFSSFDKPIYDSDGKPTFNMQTLKCQFQAPPQVGKFHFAMHVVCDSYIGFDTQLPVVLDVRDVGEVKVVESEEEISEPDEDTLAGQMHVLKTGQAPKKKVKKPVKKPVVKEESEDDESDTDGSAGEGDTSATDTETDED